MLPNSRPRAGTGTHPPPPMIVTSVFQLPCTPMPGSTEPVRYRSHASNAPSAEKRISTPDSPWIAAQTNPEMIAPGQNPHRRVSEENRNPRNVTSSVHGATSTASADRSTKYPVDG